MSVVALGAKVPVPEDDQRPLVVQPLTEPPRAVEQLPEQTVWLPPKVTVGGLTKCTITCAVAAAQGASWPVELNVSVTVPAEQSAADGLYVAFSVVVSGANVPLPEEVHAPAVAPPPTVPLKPAVALAQQIVWLPPALAVAAGLMVTTTCAAAALQAAFWPVVVSVSVTEPALISAGDGV